jgi:Domain of unknown function (DUF4402)
MTIEKSNVSLTALRTCAIILTLTLAWPGAGTGAWTSSAHAATAIMSASATIVPPVSVAEPTDIRFSRFVAGATPGTITLLVPSTLPAVSPTSQTPIERGGRLLGDGVNLVGTENCVALRSCGVGALQIGGPPSDSFSGVSTQTTTTLTSGDNTITLDSIELRYGANGTAGAVRGAGVLDPIGNGTIVMGGVLNVAARQAMGTYTGSLTVSVDY